MRLNGLPITDPASRYNPASPYAGRDNRLAQTIIFNGAQFKALGVETFFGGRNALPIAFATKTGYYLRKYVIETINLDRIYDYPAPARMIYWGSRNITIEFGKLEPGDAVEVITFRKGFT